MDEEVSIINTNTRNEKIRNLFVKNKKKIIFIFLLIIFIPLSYYSYKIYSDNLRNKISDRYYKIIIDYQNGENSNIKRSLVEVINEKDTTYSPLALYFLIDNNLEENKEEINDLFDIIIDKTPLDFEIKNLVIYKKALFNADSFKENELLVVLNPIINSDSIWKSHALFLMAEYFYSKGEKQKAKDFFNQIVLLENTNKDILTETQKRLNRDLSE